MSDRLAERPASPLGPAESPAAIAHLGMLQAVVTRLAGNSAQCKTWCVAIVSALFGLAGAVRSGGIAGAAIIPIAVFGIVDAAYLANERAYRDLYNAVAGKIRSGNYTLLDFGDLTAPVASGHYIAASLSWSVWPVYLGLFVAWLVVLLARVLA
jgi:hypothetical protein